ncbi:uncharacterized protein EAF02_003780 [Botrytis sinoallii]|uniref:uncharacterized protein n=1 Tax=Botrytis sinoallii TaxID=1463999 RepID=UPI0019009144|nr:uncharacterized protein EAF02_003780 [Botrytis sinoallii]KAF7887133.1 hypothetical protein EAF02_003780 [Botrytis sinoallii]
MESQYYPPGFGDEEVQAGGGADWWEGNQLDGGDGGPGPGNMNGGTDMGNGNNMGVNNNGNNGNGPPPRPQNSNSPPSTTEPPATTSSYYSAISTNTITTSTAAASTTSSSSPASYISSTSVNTNTTSTVNTSSSSSSSSYFSAATPTITTTTSNSSTSLVPTTSTSSASTTTSSSTIAATPLSNTGAGTQSVGVTVLPSATLTQHGLSKGSIAGITIGSLALLALILTTIWYFLRRKKKNKQHRKSIGGFGVAEWNGGGVGGNMSQVNESPSYDGKTTAGTGVQRILTWNTMRSLTGARTRASSSISQTPSTSSTASQSTLQNPFTDQPQLSSFSFPFSPAPLPKTPDHPTSNVKTVEEGPHEDIVDFGDSIDWIRKRDRMRDRERSGLTGPNLGSGLGEGNPDWRYSVRVNGGGNNL